MSKTGTIILSKKVVRKHLVKSRFDTGFSRDRKLAKHSLCTFTYHGIEPSHLQTGIFPLGQSSLLFLLKPVGW